MIHKKKFTESVTQSVEELVVSSKPVSNGICNGINLVA